MTDTVQEGNRLIAEFMGGIRKEPKNADPYYQFFDYQLIKSNNHSK